MREAWPRITNPLAPTSQKTVEIGDARIPKGAVMQTSAVYNCEVVKSIGLDIVSYSVTR